jgi:hypothetical protein
MSILEKRQKLPLFLFILFIHFSQMYIDLNREAKDWSFVNLEWVSCAGIYAQFCPYSYIKVSTFLLPYSNNWHICNNIFIPNSHIPYLTIFLFLNHSSKKRSLTIQSHAQLIHVDFEWYTGFGHAVIFMRGGGGGGGCCIHFKIQSQARYVVYQTVYGRNNV